jgi:hypothetical protein
MTLKMHTAKREINKYKPAELNDEAAGTTTTNGHTRTTKKVLL